MTGDQVLEGLGTVINSLGTVSAGSGNYDTPGDRYIRWSSDAVRILGRLIHQDDLARLVTTPRHWAIVGNAHSTGPNVTTLVNLEISEQTQTMEIVRESLRLEIRKWSQLSGELIIPDTNVYIHYQTTFDHTDWRSLLEIRALTDIHLLMPIMVVKELDRKKRSNASNTVSRTDRTPARTRARETLIKLSEFLGSPSSRHILTPQTMERGLTSISLFLDSIDHGSLPDPDSEIIDRALVIKGLSGRNVTIVTIDTAMAFNARNAELKVKLLVQTRREIFDC